MNIKLANTAGFCFGVNRAVTTVYDSLKKYKMPIFTFGPIIHNDDVVKDLEQKGVKIINDINELTNINEGIIIIRSHGVSPEVIDEIKKNDLLSIDMTCPYVKKIHKIVKENHEKGYKIIIIGDKTHPEVIGINGYCENSAEIVNGIEESYDLVKFDKVCIVAQTTLNYNTWEEIKNFIIHNKCNEYVEFNTICNATTERQKEAEDIAKSNDAVIIVGAKHSSNTQKLFSICSQYCKNCFLAQNVDDLDVNSLRNFENIGITAGASTPIAILDQIIDALNNIDQFDKNMANNTTEESDNIKEVEEVKEEISNLTNTVTTDTDIEPSKPLHITDSDNKDMSELENELDKSLRPINEGDIVGAVVVSINDDEILVDFNYKSDGIIPIEEINEDLSNISVGDKIQAVVINLKNDGSVILSKKQVDIEKSWEKAKSAYGSNSIILIKVVKEVKGGVTALFEGLRVFVPISQLSNKFVEDVNEFINTTIPAKIIEYSENPPNIVASSKLVLDENKQKNASDFWDGIFIGKEFKGSVIKIASYGAFVDIGGANGLLHASEVTPIKTDQLENYLKIDDKIDVYVKEIDKDNQKILLGYKNKPKSPWENLNKKYTVGDVLQGSITKLAPFGAFVELEPGIEGLVHISQISDKRLFKPDEVLDIGENVKVKIVSIDLENKRIGLSIKEIAPINEKGESNLDLSNKKVDLNITNEDLGVTISDAIKIKNWK